MQFSLNTDLFLNLEFDRKKGKSGGVCAGVCHTRKSVFRRVFIYHNYLGVGDHFLV